MDSIFARWNPPDTLNSHTTYMQLPITYLDWVRVFGVLLKMEYNKYCDCIEHRLACCCALVSSYYTPPQQLKLGQEQTDAALKECMQKNVQLCYLRRILLALEVLEKLAFLW